jgi:8-oxo-dGTP pyrophosphatase MutT (NUDIX family)
MKRPKALLIPYNTAGEIFIQDRRGYKPPTWGFFGGSIETGETPLQAVIRESKEELDIEITESAVIPLGNIRPNWPDGNSDRFIFLYQTDQVVFNVLEGAGGVWTSLNDANKYLEAKSERLDRIVSAIENVSKN